ncbi:PLDc N-terminal domain-containing protein, partial [Candidatus Woesearchaeota archaeon]|nr:PLDc N-terminal domain-containing protein [Candidatus Woesearchaeota archaeon]
VFWLWMLVHSMVIPKTRHLSKIAWFLIIFFLSILGAAAYFFIEFVYRKKRR